jgi:hypothetical protein
MYTENGTKEKRKFVFLGRQTINGKQQTCPSMRITLLSRTLAQLLPRTGSLGYILCGRNIVFLSKISSHYYGGVSGAYATINELVPAF